MSDKFYLFTKGQYSDYAVVALLIGPSEANLDDLSTEYVATPEIQELHKNYETLWNETWGSYQVHASAPPLEPIWMKEHHADKFAAWLISDKGFKAVPYEEVHHEQG